MATPEELKEQIASLEAELEAEEEAAAEAEIVVEEKAEEVQTAPVIASQPSIVKRILPNGQFQTPQEGTDKQ